MTAERTALSVSVAVGSGLLLIGVLLYLFDASTPVFLAVAAVGLVDALVTYYVLDVLMR